MRKSSAFQKFVLTNKLALIGALAATLVAAAPASANTGYDEPTAEASKTVVSRHYNSKLEKHFYTANEAERQAINYFGSPYAIHGYPFSAFTKSDASFTPVYRSYNPRRRAHLYTISLQEYLNAQKHGYTQLEGVAYHVYAAPATGRLPVHRIENLSKGGYFYSTDKDLVDILTGTVSGVRYHYNGVAFYAPTN